jgi:hypothetical protein
MSFVLGEPDRANEDRSEQGQAMLAIAEYLRIVKFE